jgi:hypothetical protein
VVEAKMQVAGTHGGDAPLAGKTGEEIVELDSAKDSSSPAQAAFFELQEQLERLNRKTKVLDHENQQLRCDFEKLFGDNSNEDENFAGMLAAQLKKLSESVVGAVEVFEHVSGDEDLGPVTEAKYHLKIKENDKLRSIVRHVSTRLQDLQELSQKAVYLDQCRNAR